MAGRFGDLSWATPLVAPRWAGKRGGVPPSFSMAIDSGQDADSHVVSGRSANPPDAV